MTDDTTKVTKDYSSEKLFLFLSIWGKPLLIVTIIAFFASLIFSSSYFIKPKYKSTLIMYPVSTSSISKALLSNTYGIQQDVLEFGAEEQAEQMLQILNSNLIRDRIIAKYDLANHYGIKPREKYRLTKLYKEYENNITFRRTENMAIKVSVLDHDPQTAADIANDIAALFDSTKTAMQRERALKAFHIVEGEYLKKQAEIQQMEDSLVKLRELGVFDYETQTEMINQQLAVEIARGNTRGIQALQAQLDVLARYGGAYVSIRNQLEFEKKQLSDLKAKYEEARVDAFEFLPQKFVVTTAYKAEKKSYPIRWLIVTLTVISSLFLATIIIIVLENYSSLKAKKKISNPIILSP
ncbi:MAG TPA: hypothetical protein PLG54_05215 [Bacteroidales bacterium]|jgi:uncharacterized protein involved in exopolysaccharide biosynthesis|nr:MAG: Chain length determinant protein [Bacteroidetes bacterium ADurb.Bin012]HOR04897.1 hypothetical protein [Bacteroidales bacterium]